MDVNAPNPLTSAAQSTAQTRTDTAAGETRKSGEATSGSALTGDFKTFIQLLTAQMQNQDPLEPTSNTEFVAQLASFSAVEQQVLTNDNLSTILGQLTMGQAGDMASWIGKDVLVEGGLSAYDGSPVPVEVEPVEDADKAVLLVRNEAGTTVARIDADADETTLAWNGADQHGNALPAGLYSFRLESYSDGSVIDTQDARAFSTVSEIRVTDEGPQLMMAGGKSVSADRITALR